MYKAVLTTSVINFKLNVRKISLILGLFSFFFQNAPLDWQKDAASKRTTKNFLLKGRKKLRIHTLWKKLFPQNFPKDTSTAVLQTTPKTFKLKVQNIL